MAESVDRLDVAEEIAEPVEEMGALFDDLAGADGEGAPPGMGGGHAGHKAAEAHAELASLHELFGAVGDVGVAGHVADLIDASGAGNGVLGTAGGVEVHGDGFSGEEVGAGFDDVEGLGVVGGRGDGDEDGVERFAGEHFAVVGIADAALFGGDACGGLGVDVADGRDGAAELVEAFQVAAGDPAYADETDSHSMRSSLAKQHAEWDRKVQFSQTL